MLVDTFKRMWSNDSFYLLCQSKWHEFWDAQVDSAPECDSKVDTQHLSISSINEEVIQMTISDAKQI